MKTYTQDEVVELIIKFVNDLSWRDLLHVVVCKARGKIWLDRTA